MHKAPVQNEALITALSPEISGHVSAGWFQPVCLRAGSFTAGTLTSSSASSLSSVRYLLNLNS